MADHAKASSSQEMVPAYKLRAVFAVLAEREAELLEIKGPCSDNECCLHYAHRGPHDIKKAPKTEVKEIDGA